MMHMHITNERTWRQEARVARSHGLAEAFRTLASEAPVLRRHWRKLLGPTYAEECARIRRIADPTARQIAETALAETAAIGILLIARADAGPATRHTGGLSELAAMRGMGGETDTYVLVSPNDARGTVQAEWFARRLEAGLASLGLEAKVTTHAVGDPMPLATTPGTPHAWRLIWGCRPLAAAAGFAIQRAETQHAPLREPLAA